MRVQQVFELAKLSEASGFLLVIYVLILSFQILLWHRDPIQSLVFLFLSLAWDYKKHSHFHLHSQQN